MSAEPGPLPRRPIGMTALDPPATVPPARRRRPAAWAGVLAAAACLLAGGCSASRPPASSSPAGTAHAAFAPEVAPAPGSAAGGTARARQAGKRLSLTALAAPGQSIIYTAGLTVQAANVQAAVSRATSAVAAAGGYVSAEHTSLSRNRSTGAMVSIQFKIPVGYYRATLGTLGGLGRRLSESQRAQDVTQTVADVTSRVASAHAMISQLRKLLARAGTVSGLLGVQDQISQDEASLEALQAQQRALAGETTYATVSMVIVGPPAAHHRHHHKAAAGFVGGLAAGWHALRMVVATALTIAGAALPFAVIAALVAAAAYAARRRLARRKTGTSPAQ
jgi:Domain of unknown function (DUF4349)